MSPRGVRGDRWGGAACRVAWAAVALLLVVMPALDLAWGEPPGHGVPCQLQANPGIAPTLPDAVGSWAPIRLVVPEPQEWARGFMPSIFVPPRP